MGDFEEIDAPASRLRLGVGALIVLVVLALGAVVIVALFSQPPGDTQRISGGAVPQQEIVADIYVHVEGAVRAPGMYRLPRQARLMDAVSAAGGFTDDADRARINLAREIDDGEQLVVPSVGEQEADPGEARSQPAEAGLVNLNTAGVAELERLPKVGPALAQRIVQWREQNGRFRSVDDLLSVSGIGPKVFEGLRASVTL